MFRTVALALLMMSAAVTHAADYKIDTDDAHAFVQFRIQHLGYSWLYGRFNQFEGSFSYSEKAPEKASANVTIDVTSLDSNHAERDKHLRGSDFFDVKKYPKATFVSKSYTPKDATHGVLVGTLTLKGISKDISIDVEQVGHGPDPWGGVRRGFTGKAEITLKDFGFTMDLGPASAKAEILIDVEGVRR